MNAKTTSVVQYQPGAYTAVALAGAPAIAPSIEMADGSVSARKKTHPIITTRSA